MKRHLLLLTLLAAASTHAVDYSYDALGRLRAESFANGAHILHTFDTVSVAGNFTGTTAINPANVGIIAAQGHIGLPMEGGGNLISGLAIGISSTATDVFMRNNLIGTDATRESALSNTQAGILVRGGGARSLIDGPGLQDGNLISGNTGSGVRVDPAIAGGSASGMVIEANQVRVDVSGAPLGNGGEGIDLGAR